MRVEAEAFPPPPYRGPVEATAPRAAVATIGPHFPWVEVLAAVAAPVGDASTGAAAAILATAATALAAVLLLLSQLLSLLLALLLLALLLLFIY